MFCIEEKGLGNGIVLGTEWIAGLLFLESVSFL